MYRILIIDDDQYVCKSLELLLKKNKYEALSVHSPALVLEKVQFFRPQLILLDMNFTIDTSGRQGLKMLDQLVAFDSSLQIILITGWATLQLAVEGMKKGAKDFLAKPWDNQHLLSSVATSLALCAESDTDAPSETTEEHIIGCSDAFRQVLSKVDKVAKTDASVLITGESGTGKEVIAEAIHQRSKRANAPFVKVNLGGISSSLFESEMFGHVRGAFTDAHTDREGRFAKAQTGSIFLDEIGDLSLVSQVKLLRVLQEKTYEVLGSSKTMRTDVRVISATNRALTSMVNEGSFREDLYYRINLIEISMPTLADRREDIPLLVQYFGKNVCRMYELDPPFIDDRAMLWLQNQSYRGNIRELRNVVERTFLLAQQKRTLEISDFQDNFIRNVSASGDQVELPFIGQFTLDELERRMILKTLNYHHHSITKTATSLGITRSSLYRRLEKYGIPLVNTLS